MKLISSISLLATIELELWSSVSLHLFYILSEPLVQASNIPAGKKFTTLKVFNRFYGVSLHCAKTIPTSLFYLSEDLAKFCRVIPAP